MVGIWILVLIPLVAVVYGCKEPSHIALRKVNHVPSCENEITVTCSNSEHKVIYVINVWRNETLIVCACDVELFGGYCPELNSGKIQESYLAPCLNFIDKPCPQKFNASQSYKFPGCFQKFGGIPSPKSSNEQLERTIQKLQKDLMDRDNHLSVQNMTINENSNAVEMLGHKISELETTNVLIVCLAVAGGIILLVLIVVACVILCCKRFDCSGLITGMNVGKTKEENDDDTSSLQSDALLESNIATDNVTVRSHEARIQDEGYTVELDVQSEDDTSDRDEQTYPNLNVESYL
jgi:hypothetical protein